MKTTKSHFMKVFDDRITWFVIGIVINAWRYIHSASSVSSLSSAAFIGTSRNYEQMDTIVRL